MQTVETLNEGLRRAYRITISRKDIDARVDGELKRVAPQMRMPGFRPGKVPPNLVRKMHGAAIEQEALNSAVQDGVQQLMNEQKLRPAMQPSVELEDGGPGKDAVVKVELETLPDVPDPKIEGLKLERLTVEPSRRARTMPRSSETSSSSTMRVASTANRSKAARASRCGSSSAPGG
jgi:trigger factor